jgi:hypothetical protein
MAFDADGDLWIVADRGMLEFLGRTDLAPAQGEIDILQQAEKIDVSEFTLPRTDH